MADEALSSTSVVVGRVSNSSKRSYDAQDVPIALTETTLPEIEQDSKLPPPPYLSAADERRLYRKIDLRLMPILTLMYLCSFLDRGSSRDLLYRCWLTEDSRKHRLVFGIVRYTFPSLPSSRQCQATRTHDSTASYGK